jgi:hypothetical protein
MALRCLETSGSVYTLTQCRFSYDDNSVLKGSNHYTRRHWKPETTRIKHYGIHLNVYYITGEWVRLMQRAINMLFQNFPVGTEEDHDNLERNLRSAEFQSVTPWMRAYCCSPDNIDVCFIASLIAWVWFATLH